jgi:DNA-binding IscR family transcriptional regulator
MLRYVFFTEMQVEQAAKILNEIVTSSGIVPDSEWERFVLSSRGLYVKVMRKLRDVGLVEKRMGDYRLARDFSSALTKISKYWADIVDEFNEGDRSIAF